MLGKKMEAWFNPQQEPVPILSVGPLLAETLYERTLVQNANLA